MQSASDTLEQIIDIVLDVRNDNPDLSQGIDKVLSTLTDIKIRDLAISGRPLR